MKKKKHKRFWTIEEDRMINVAIDRRDVLSGNGRLAAVAEKLGRSYKAVLSRRNFLNRRGLKRGSIGHWTAAEDEQILQTISRRRPDAKALAVRLGRTVHAVNQRLLKLRRRLDFKVDLQVIYPE